MGYKAGFEICFEKNDEQNSTYPIRKASRLVSLIRLDAEFCCTKAHLVDVNQVCKAISQIFHRRPICVKASVTSCRKLLSSCMGEHGGGGCQGVLFVCWGSRVVVAGDAEIRVHLEQVRAEGILDRLIGHMVGHPDQTICRANSLGMCMTQSYRPDRILRVLRARAVQQVRAEPACGTPTWQAFAWLV